MRVSKLLQAAGNALKMGTSTPNSYHLMSPKDFQGVFENPEVLSKFFPAILGLPEGIADIEVLSIEDTTVSAKYYLPDGSNSLAALKCACFYTNHLVAQKDMEALLKAGFLAESPPQRADSVVMVMQHSGLFSPGMYNYSTNMMSGTPSPELATEFGIKTSLTVYDPSHWASLNHEDITAQDHWMRFFADPNSQTEAMALYPELYQEVAKLLGNDVTASDDSTIG
jgi:hypothetical protein